MSAQGDPERLPPIPLNLPQGALPALFVKYRWGRTGTNAEQIGALFEFTESPFKGRSIVWYGGFTEPSFPITYRGLVALGWKGERLDTLKDDLAYTADSPVRVVLVCEPEYFNGNWRSKVKFINRPADIRFAKELTKEEKLSIGTVVQAMIDRGVHKRKAGDEPAGGLGSDDIPF